MTVTRYEPIASYVGAGEFLGDAEEAALGEFVLYSDYVELERERDQLRELVVEYLAELDNPAPDYTMRREYRRRMAELVDSARESGGEG